MIKSGTQRPAAKSMRKNIGFCILALTLSMLVALLIGEVVVRILSPQQEAMKWFSSDPKYGYVLKKNFHQRFRYVGTDVVMDVDINSFGHRYAEYAAAALKNPSVRKILLLGDSFVFGHGINMEDHFAVILEKLLGGIENNNLVINAGVGGWGTLQATSYAHDHFAVFAPDVIVYTFCGNDPSDDLRFQHGLSDNKKGVYYFPGKILLRDNSHLYRWIYSEFHVALHNVILKKRIGDNDKRERAVDLQSASLISEVEWKLSLERIRKFHQKFLDFNPNGILFIQATSPWHEDTRSHLKQLSNGGNLIYVDLYDATSSLNSQQRRLPHDEHWSERIHDIAAQAIFEALNDAESARNMNSPLKF